MSCAHPLDCSKRIVEFADAVIEMSLAHLGATKIEPQRLITRANKRTRQGMCNLVVHGATMLRMRMTDDRTTLQGSLARTLDDRLKTADGSVQKELLAYRM